MTDKVRKQIEDDAKKYWTEIGGPSEDPNGLHEDSYIEGACTQDPIAEKRGWNAAIDKAYVIVDSLLPEIDGGREFTPGQHLSHAKANVLQQALKELEKMKR